jgi:hypothetical protein
MAAILTGSSTVFRCLVSHNGPQVCGNAAVETPRGAGKRQGTAAGSEVCLWPRPGTLVAPANRAMNCWRWTLAAARHPGPLFELWRPNLETLGKLGCISCRQFAHRRENSTAEPTRAPDSLPVEIPLHCVLRGPPIPQPNHSTPHPLRVRWRPPARSPTTSQVRATHGGRTPSPRVSCPPPGHFPEPRD